MLKDIFFGTNASANIVLSVAIMLFSGFIVTRLTKRCKLPNVTGYILAGILIGPYILNLIPGEIILGMDFITDVALAFIAFGVGKYFRIKTLHESGARIIIITLFEALTAAVVVSLVMIFVFHLPVSFSILLGAIGSATAPASTIMTIRQYKAKGELVDTVLQVVALDDAVALIAFSICAAISVALSDNNGLQIGDIVTPLMVNLISIGLGILAGFVLSRLINGRRSKDHKLVLVIATILTLTGFCTKYEVSPLLSCMVLGTAYINFTGDKTLFKQINNFSPPITLMFFVLSGLKLNLPSLRTAGIIGLTYFFVRIIGKCIGAYLGSRVGKASPTIRAYLGLALIPQAGVSIGLASLGQRILHGPMGTMLSTIILSSAVLYEMIGPACAKLALILSGTIQPETRKSEPKEKEPTDPPKNE